MAFSKLYQERPEDPIKFIRSEISGGLPEPEEVKSIRDQIETLVVEQKAAKVNESASKVEEKKLTNKEIQRILTEKFERLQSSGDEDKSSLLKRHLTKKLLDKLMKKKTKYNGSLLDNVKCGLMADSSHEVGIFASDQDAYVKFALLFNPVLEEYHVKVDNKEAEEVVDASVDTLVDIDPEMKFIESISIKVSRNINEIPFVSIASLEQMNEVAEKIKNVLTEINDDDNDALKGKFYDLADFDDEQMSKWFDNDIFIDRDSKSCSFCIAAAHRFWPNARGVFINDKNNIKLWINKEEHIHVVSHEIGGNLKSVYKRVSQMVEKFKDIEFAQHDKWGFLAHNLTNVGHSTRISVQVKITQLTKEENEDNWKKLTEKLHVKKSDDRLELISKPMVGVSDIEMANQFQKLVSDIISAEKCLFIAA